MSGVAREAIALSLVLGVLLGLAFAAVEAVRALFSLGRIATAAARPSVRAARRPSPRLSWRLP